MLRTSIGPLCVSPCYRGDGVPQISYQLSFDDPPLSGDEEPSGTDEKSGPHAPRPRAVNPELVSRQRREISSAAVEGLNNKIRVVTRRSYGFRTFEAMEVALYHTLGRLSEPESAHRFC
jgi:hypothetical protein